MNVRIRYAAAEPGVLQSVRIFSREDREFRVRLFEAQNRYEIVDATTSALVQEGRGLSMANTKLKAKNALMNLGVAFGGEARAKPGGSE